MESLYAAEEWRDIMRLALCDNQLYRTLMYLDQAEEGRALRIMFEAFISSLREKAELQKKLITYMENSVVPYCLVPK